MDVTWEFACIVAFAAVVGCGACRRRKKAFHPLAPLPPTVASEPYRRLPSSEGAWMTSTTVPSGLLKRHNTKAGVWGCIHVHGGRLRYRVLEPTPVDYVVEDGCTAVIRPQEWHEVFFLDDTTTFCVTFHKARGAVKQD